MHEVNQRHLVPKRLHFKFMLHNTSMVNRNWDRRESLSKLAGTSDDDTPEYIRAVPGHCSRPTANFEFKNMIELPLRLTTGIYHSNSKQYLDTILLNVLSAGRNKQERKQTSMFLLGLASPTTQCST